MRNVLKNLKKAVYRPIRRVRINAARFQLGYYLQRGNFAEAFLTYHKIKSLY